MAELTKRGLVTAVICSDPFLKLGKNQARKALQVPKVRDFIVSGGHEPE